MYFKTEWESIDWVQRDEYMDQWLAVLFTVMEIQVKKKTENHRLAETVLAVQK